MATSLSGPDNLALLRAISAPADQMSDAWSAWADRVDIDDLSRGAYRLLPALYRKVEATGHDHPWMARLRGIYRRHWAENQLHRAAFDAAASSLRAAGVEFLGPADQQVSRFFEEPGDYPLRRARVAVDWWSAPAALAGLTSDGWRIDEESSPGTSVRERLTRTNWHISRDDGVDVELVNNFNPYLSDERRDADVWERARSASTTAPPLASADDVFVAALTDELDATGPVLWVLAGEAVLRAEGDGLDLRAALDRPAARGVLPVVVSRLEFLSGTRHVEHAARLLADARELADRHRLPATLAERSADWGRRRVRALARRPTAAREIVRRFGGLTGLREYLGGH